jgi:hypothetical protein
MSFILIPITCAVNCLYIDIGNKMQYEKNPVCSVQVYFQNMTKHAWHKKKIPASYISYIQCDAKQLLQNLVPEVLKETYSADKIFSGDQPCQLLKNYRRRENHLHYHHTLMKGILRYSFCTLLVNEK